MVDPSSPNHGSGPSGAGRPAWPRRGHYFLLAGLFLAIAAYGSLVPFRLWSLGFHEAVEHFRDVLKRPLSGSRSDWAVNMLLFVPIGYCLTGALAVDRRNRFLALLWVPPVMLACGASSLAIEFAQCWFPGRFPAASDVLAQVIGTFAGMILWFVVGQTLTDWLRLYTAGQRPKEQVDWLLQAYLLGLLVYSVLPLDLIVSPADLYRLSRVVLTPFSDVSWGPLSLGRLLFDVAIFLPVGMLTATWLTTPGRFVRPMSTSVLLGSLIVLAVELIQLPVRSRFTSTTDLITGTLGVALGAWLMHRWRGRGEEALPQPADGGMAWRVWLWLGLAAIYAVLLAVVFCWPFERIDDAWQIRTRFEGFFRVPLAAYYRGTPWNAISDILKKLVLFAPLGAMAAMAVGPLPVPRGVRRILLALLLLCVAGVGIGIEMAQVLLPPHVPDATDVLLYTAGAAVGMFVTLRVLDARRRDC